MAFILSKRKDKDKKRPPSVAFLVFSTNYSLQNMSFELENDGFFTQGRIDSAWWFFDQGSLAFISTGTSMNSLCSNSLASNFGTVNPQESSAFSTWKDVPPWFVNRKIVAKRVLGFTKPKSYTVLSNTGGSLGTGLFLIYICNDSKLLIHVSIFNFIHNNRIFCFHSKLPSNFRLLFG